MTSALKDLKKKLPSMSLADKQCLQFALDKQLEREVNPMIRSSICARLRLLNIKIGLYPGQRYCTMGY